ncbi:MAG: NADH pyrophosphatase zinc ribbon domain-containing protein [Thermoproteota archaeon]
MSYCPECGGEMKYVSATRSHVCKSCGLSVNRQELMELRQNLRPNRETGEEQRKRRRKDYLKWWFSEKE